MLKSRSQSAFRSYSFALVLHLTWKIELRAFLSYLKKFFFHNDLQLHSTDLLWSLTPSTCLSSRWLCTFRIIHCNYCLEMILLKLRAKTLTFQRSVRILHCETYEKRIIRWNWLKIMNFKEKGIVYRKRVGTSFFIYGILC